MGGGGRDKPMAINETAERGRAVVSVYADGRVTGLSVHLREGTRLAVRAYPAEGRVVLEAGEPGTGSVQVFVPSAGVLAGLIDVLNAAHGRLSVGERRRELPCQPGEPAGARPRPRLSGSAPSAVARDGEAGGSGARRTRHRGMQVGGAGAGRD